jgi:hypothetical protein
MPDEVWPLESGERVRLSSFNGIGFGLKGFTRKDSSGMYFATRYFTVVYLPVLPLDRFYLTETGIQYQDIGVASTTVTSYRIVGRSRLRIVEILRTYLYFLLTLSIVLVPILLWLGHADELGEAIGFWWVLGGFVGWLLGSVVGIAVLTITYRDRWAPIREAEVLPRRRSRY